MLPLKERPRRSTAQVGSCTADACTALHTSGWL